MTVSIVLSNLTNLNNQTSAVSTINQNSQAITTAFSSALDTQGDQMDGTLDMNSNRLINLPLAQTSTEPLRVIDAATLNGGGTIEVEGVPAGGSTGQVLTKNSNTSYDTVWSPVPGINPGSSGLMPVYTSATSIDPLSNVRITGGSTSAAQLSLGTSGQPGSVQLFGSVTGSYQLAVPNTTNGNFIFPSGSTNLGSTGGSSQVVLQASASGPLTVRRLSATDLTNGTTGSGSVVLNSSPTFTGNNFIPLNQLVAETQGYSILGNPTGGVANYTPFQITGLATKPSPTTADILLISDQAGSGQLKQTTIGQAVASQVSGIATLNGLTGNITLQATDGTNITSSASTVLIGAPGGLVNKIMNGNFDIWQRGNTITVATNNLYGPDRWLVSSASGTATVTQVAGRSSGNSVYAMQIAGASSSTISVLIQQRIESFIAAPLGNSVATFQAWIFNNTGTTLTPTISFNVPTSQDSFGSVSTYSATSLQACTASAWTQVGIAISTPSTINGIAPVLSFGNSLNTSSKSVQVAEVDFRKTPSANMGLLNILPPVEFRPIWDEMAGVSRYYTQTYPLGTTPGTTNATSGYYETLLGVAGGFPNTSWQMCVHYTFKTTMRAIPSVTTYSPITGTAGRVRDGQTANDLTSVIGSAGTQGVNITAGTIATTFPFWYGHLTASAEL